MKRTVQSLLAILVILGVGVPLWTFVIAVAPEPPQAPPRDLGPVPVAVEPVAPRDIQLEVEVYGTLLPLRRMAIACELGGRIETLYPDWRPGARVVAGTELIALEQEPFLIGLEQAEARLAEAGAG
ncbi:MAG: hypothetical protein O7B99_01870, partial [Planctomycetota bacterium]|nr:hypothetical protein [Planctomycetota bacterium]